MVVRGRGTDMLMVSGLALGLGLAEEVFCVSWSLTGARSSFVSCSSCFSSGLDRLLMGLLVGSRMALAEEKQKVAMLR